MDFSIKKDTANAVIHKYFTDRIQNTRDTYYQLLPQDLVAQAIELGEGVLSNTGALVIDTGAFTGRSPKDRYIFKDELTATTINWNEFNQPLEEKYFDQLFNKMMIYMKTKKLWVRDCTICAKNDYRLHLRVVNENPCCNLFAYNMFLRPEEEPEGINPGWHLIQLPHFTADPLTDGVNRGNFVILHFTQKIILIGGTQYTGEMKKAVFSILNFILPKEKNVLSMHCAANVGEKEDTALFFGLSGTGKTTLSASPERKLIGDDEHGWDDEEIFNIEGGCYAKAINLDAAKEPDIYKAVQFGAVAENVVFFPGSNTIDFNCNRITENTRVSYPLHYISNALNPSVAKSPTNIFFLTADAFGILPPISKLSPQQTMYHFISGYTARVAGTEEGVLEPRPTFSACFGAPFLPLHPVVYAKMLGEKIKQHKVNVWLINTGWSGGAYGVGTRIPLHYTRAMIAAALKGKLENEEYRPLPFFGLMMPSSCPGVPASLLNPEVAWEDKGCYLEEANKLAEIFIKNFTRYTELISPEIISAGPSIVKEK